MCVPAHFRTPHLGAFHDRSPYATSHLADGEKVLDELPRASRTLLTYDPDQILFALARLVFCVRVAHARSAGHRGNASVGEPASCHRPCPIIHLWGSGRWPTSHSTAQRLDSASRKLLDRWQMSNISIAPLLIDVLQGKKLDFGALDRDMRVRQKLLSVHLRSTA